jgi:ADP-heptose:LPS heptosyltransferase
MLPPLVAEPTRTPTEPQDVKRVLVLELWNIGDVVLALPFLQQLRERFPRARIAFVGRAYARELLGPSGVVDEFIETDLAWQNSGRRWNVLAYHWIRLAALIRKLRGQQFDIAFQCRPHVREYVILALSGAKRRVGMRMIGWDRLLTDRLPIDVFKDKKKESWLRLLEPFGGPHRRTPQKLAASASAREWAKGFLATRGVSTEDLVIGVHPGASIAEKRWPLDRFEDVIRWLAARAGVRVLVFVEPGGYGSALEAKDGRITAKVGLPQMVALLERCDLLVCNDSGPMHIAGALGVSCVAVFSAGIAEMFEPLGSGHQVVSPDHDLHSGPRTSVPPPPYTVTEVPTARVLDAIEHALG